MLFQSYQQQLFSRSLLSPEAQSSLQLVFLHFGSVAVLVPEAAVMAPEMEDLRMTSVKPRIRYNTIGGVNGPLVILDNVGHCEYP